MGWLVVGRLDDVDLAATDRARNRVLEELERALPGFDWRMPVVRRKDLREAIREEPVFLLDHGVGERSAKSWDFALVITGTDLVSHYRPYALGVVSRSVDVAVVSTSRIDPDGEAELSEEERTGRLAHRIYVLVLHLFGHMNGLVHVPDRGRLMYEPCGVADLDLMESFSPGEIRQLEEELRRAADARLEEQEGAADSRLRFYLRAAWQERSDIGRSVRDARPWLLPFHLSRLTTAALSALLILLVTAESWDLGMSQSPGFIAALSILALVVTTAYILKRQRLLVRYETGRLGEQTVIANVAITLSIALGLVVTYAGLFLLVLAVALVVFPERLVEGWAASLEGGVALSHYFVLAGFIASLGIVIGSLGASFEEQQYFRHIAYVDEEI